jgi:hypothetical protein
MNPADTIALRLTQNTDAFWNCEISIERFRAANSELWREAEAAGLANEVRDLITNHYRPLPARPNTGDAE